MQFTAYRPQCHAFAFGGVGFGVHLVGDRESGVIARMSPTLGRDIDGTVIRRVRQAPHISKDGAEVTINSLQLDIEVGLGLPTGQGSEPVVMLQESKDGAKTWGPERWKNVGAQGQYKKTVQWNRFGQSRDRVVRIIVTDPIPWRIAGAYIDAEVGIS